MELRRYPLYRSIMSRADWERFRLRPWFHPGFVHKSMSLRGFFTWLWVKTWSSKGPPVG